MLKQTDPKIYEFIKLELERQRNVLEMIPSENFPSLAVLEALGSVLNNKYSEGYPRKRYYGGNQYIDEVEQLAIDRAKELFEAEHVNVQPLSGAPANIAVYSALLEPGDTVLGMHLSHGGHLTHGHPVTFMAKIYNFVRYKTNLETGLIDYDELYQMAKKENPKMILAGFSSYSREVDYRKIKEIADEVGALTMMDMAHIAGLIAGKQLTNPVPIFDVVTTTTHKTLRGPRGAMILCKKQYAKAIDKAVFPGLQGGPHEHAIAAKAVSFKEALTQEFQEYAKQVIANNKALENELKKYDFKICFNTSENHLLMIDLTNKNITGKKAETALDEAGITVNKNVVPDEPRSPLDPSGIRIGPPALTSRGFTEEDMVIVGQLFHKLLSDPTDEQTKQEVQNTVKELTKKHPLYPELNMV